MFLDASDFVPQRRRLFVIFAFNRLFHFPSELNQAGLVIGPLDPVLGPLSRMFDRPMDVHDQGIELFTALRRLQKPSWMLVYNTEAHNLVQTKNRKDLSIRMMQFFDHYLMGAPLPVWMGTGVPAVMKSKTLGTELLPRGGK